MNSSQKCKDLWLYVKKKFEGGVGMNTENLEKRVHDLEKHVVAHQRIYYKLSEACEAASVTRNTLKKWVKQGLLPEIVIDGVTRIKRVDLELFMDSRKK